MPLKLRPLDQDEVEDGLRAERDAAQEAFERAFEAVEAVAGPDVAEAMADAAGGGFDGPPPPPPPRPPGGDGGGGGRGGGDAWTFERLRVLRIAPNGQMIWADYALPEDCPVTPLGTYDGTHYFLNARGELIERRVSDLSQAMVEDLFGGDTQFLVRGWPQATARNENGRVSYTVKGFHLQYARMALTEACHQAGMFDKRNHVRGLGTWTDDDGRLILHLGDCLVVDAAGPKPMTTKPGKVGGMVYPARPKRVPRPTPGPASEMEALLERFSGWRFQRGERDARLLLGQLGSFVVAGALQWRPMVFITGDAASGKSTLQREMRAMMAERIVSTVNATEASLRSIMGVDAMPVSFDEIEADGEDHGRASDIMKLARYAASGDTIYRATKDQGVNEFVLKGGMVFSAINIPRMRAQDKQRFCFLRVVEPPKDRAFNEMDPRRARETGQVLAGRMVAGWNRWHATLSAYRRHLLAEGHSSRGADQFGTLLACADLLLCDELDDERVFQVCRQYPRDDLHEYEDVEQNFALYWRVLLAATPEAWRGTTLPSVGEVLGDWLRKAKAGGQAEDQNGDSLENLRAKLERAGLGVVTERGTGRYWLAIPNNHPRTQRLFKDTDLQGGGWQHALRTGRPWHKTDNPEGLWRMQQCVIDGARTQCTQINLTGLHDFGDGVKRVLFVERGAGEDGPRLDV